MLNLCRDPDDEEEEDIRRLAREIELTKVLKLRFQFI